MKVTLSNLGEEFLQDYKLVKKIDNNFINETIEGEILYLGEKNEYLVTSAINSLENETGTIFYKCPTDDFEKDVILSHKEGTFDFNKCTAKKTIKFKSPLDCVADGDTNIFLYNSQTIDTVQGDIEKIFVRESKVYFDQFSTEIINFDFCLNLVGGIPDKSNEGFYPENLQLYAIPILKEIQPNGGAGKEYVGHDVILIGSYVAFKSNVKHSNNWTEIDGFYYYNNKSQGEWKSAYTEVIPYPSLIDGLLLFTNFAIEKKWEKGRFDTFKDIPISNTIDFKEVLQAVFQCTGFTLRSNFFGINVDGTAPENKYYDFATDQYQNLRIVQSFDIIREGAIQDSFSNSGLISNKDLITDICLMFNLLIHADTENSVIRIEHLSYYTNKGIDVTEKDYEVSTFDLNQEQIDKEVWQMAQPTPSDGFFTTEIKYKNIDLFKEEFEKIYKTKRIITDVFGTLNNKDYEGDIYKTLFYLIATDGTSIMELNDSLSIESLFLNFHDINRPLRSGHYKGEKIQFGGFSVGFTATLKLKGSPLMWNDIYPMHSVKIKNGTYLISETELDKNQLLTLKIKL